MTAVAKRLGAGVVELSVDSADVDTLARRSANRPIRVTASQGGERWQDAGYWLVPVIALISLLWARRGWSVRSRI